MAEILSVLYFRHLRHNPLDPRDEDRDRLVLSKGHGAPGLYAALAEAGIMAGEELLTLRRLGSRLQGHPSARDLPGVDASSGSLGQGLSIALGLALGFRGQGRPNRVFCILGDGELQEGQCWEAAMAAAAFGVDNLVAIVDRNGLQSDGATETVMPLGDLAAKWRAFGWSATEVDGHSVAQLDAALVAAGEQALPAVVIARTVKGKGVELLEGRLDWSPQSMTEEQYRQALVGLADA
jgi:transketolase